MLDPKAAKMEAALLGGLIRAIVPKPISVCHKRYKLHKSVKGDIEFLVKELRLIVGSIDDGISEQGEDHGAVSGLLIEDLRELAFGIEDFLDSLMYHSIWKQQPASFQKIVRLPKMLRARLQFAGSAERRRLRNLTTEAYERRKRFTATGPAHQQHSVAAASAPMGESPSSVFHPRNVGDTDLVGVEGLRAELLEQLADAKGPMKVISIVGFCGLGKTAVAAQVYNRETDAGRFEKHAWVCAAGKRPTEVLTDVLSELNADAGSSKGTARELCEGIRNQLHNKRYFIVIDDIQTEDMWGNINSAFPDNNGFSSRILVTTTIQPVAIACSSAESYMHKMRRLDEGCSKQLFTSKTCPEEYSCYKQPDCLKLDETLDLRASMVAKLREELFHMPCLVHLFGKFKLPDAVDFPKERRSVLQTLAGFIADGSQSYSKLVDHMIKLRKVKVWCESSLGAGGTEWNNLQEAIQRFIQDKNVRNIGDRSLSLHFDRTFKNSLNSLKEPCYLSSLKLHGELDALPQFVISLRGLKELCLSSVKFTAGFLEALTQLSDLKYLKLIADDLEKFTIKAKAFPSLLRLCFVLQHPTFPTIQEGSMKHLKTLQLVCKDLHGLCGIKMEYMKLLKEVILHDGVDPHTWVKWEEAAKEHPNKPKVLPSKTAEISKWVPTEDSDVLVPPKTEFTENSATSIGCLQDKFTSMPVNQGLESSAEPKTYSICTVQESSDGGTNMGVFEVSPLTNFSETATNAESEPMLVCVPVELTKVESANNFASTAETIEQIETQIPVNKQSSIDGPKRQNTDIQNHAFKSTGLSEDSLSTELSITGHGMVPSHTLEGCWS